MLILFLISCIVSLIFGIVALRIGKYPIPFRRTLAYIFDFLWVITSISNAYYVVSFSSLSMILNIILTGILALLCMIIAAIIADSIK